MTLNTLKCALSLLRTQISAVGSIYPSDRTLAREAYLDAVNTQHNAVDIANALPHYNVDIPISVATELVNHTESVILLGALFGS
jgi:hypothetical protein